MSHSVIIIDDEPPARAKLARFVAQIDDFRVVAEATSVEEAIEAIRTVAPDVVYLDIKLGNRSGFEVIDELRENVSPLIVFTTAYSEHAVRAFDVQALDYLLKPFDFSRFMNSVERIRRVLAEPELGDIEERIRRLLAARPDRPAAALRILIRNADRAYFIAVNEIQRISAAGNYVEVYVNGKVHLIRESLTGFIAQLDAREFLRVHRSHVVRVGYITAMRKMYHGDYELLLQNGEILALSRRYKALLPEEIRERL